MNDLAIVCFSCDKNDEVWPTFKICLDKYWPNHPKTYLFTETHHCNIMETINFDYPLNEWTTRIIKSLEAIKENTVLFICDDVFLDDFVNLEKLQKCLDILSVKVCSPWRLEGDQNILNYEVYQVDKEKALSWFRDGPKQCGAKYSGKWAKELPLFLKKEGIVMDLEKKGFNLSE